MAEEFLLYYITGRAALGPDENTRRHRLLEKIGEAARHGVNYIQLRERDLCGRELENLACDAMRVIQENSYPGRKHTALLINSRTDIALAVSADGVHLRGDDLSVTNVRTVWSRACGQMISQTPIISVACHAPEDVARAAANGADLALLAPIFEKKDAPTRAAIGLEVLREAGRAPLPVIALGGVTLENAEACRKSGAAGIAGIRLFQENDIGSIVHGLRRG